MSLVDVAASAEGSRDGWLCGLQKQRAIRFGVPRFVFPYQVDFDRAVKLRRQSWAMRCSKANLLALKMKSPG